MYLSIYVCVGVCVCAFIFVCLSVCVCYVIDWLNLLLGINCELLFNDVEEPSGHFE